MSDEGRLVMVLLLSIFNGVMAGLIAGIWTDGNNAGAVGLAVCWWSFAVAGFALMAVDGSRDA